MDTLGLEAYKEFVHFGLTSQDINNTAIPLSLKEAMAGCLLPRRRRGARQTGGFRRASGARCRCWRARTASPLRPRRWARSSWFSSNGIEKQLAMLHDIAVPAKFGGATGNFNAHRAAYPQYDWVAFANRFVGRDAGALPLAVHHADRTLRQLGRDLRQHEAHRHHPHRPLRATCGPIFRWNTSNSRSRPARSDRAPCRTKSIRSTSRTPRATSASPTPSSNTSRRSSPSRASSATSPTRPCCATSACRWPTRRSRCDRCSRG